MTRTHKLIPLAIAAALVAGACGGEKPSTTSPGRTVRVDMVDLAFRPSNLSVKRGETVRFVFRNQGKVAHDAFIGDQAAQAEHEKEMRGMDGMGHGGRDTGITVEPGKTKELTYTFKQSGKTQIACHQPGHWAAGMVASVDVG